MLVLSRKRNERIMVGNAVITVVDIRGDKIRLGIEAPADVRIDREEIHNRIAQEGRQGHGPKAA